MATILVLHGPNLALQGLSTINSRLEERASELGVELTLVQSNGEAALVDALHEHQHEVEAIIVNPGVLAPFAYALAEGLALLKKPSIEVLLAAPTRGPSALTGIVLQHVHDRAADGYVVALEHLAKQVAPEGAKGSGGDGDGDDDGRPTGPRAPLGKSLGRRPKEDPAAPAARPAKTIGRMGKSTEAAPVATTPVDSGRLTRQVVKGRITLRLENKTSPEELATWARTQWSDLQRGGPVEEGSKELLDTVLLTLMGGAKATDHILLAQLAKLES